ncbi:Transcriptional regulator PadR-like family protein [Candidatus Bilamarchaeum dharawalense]|uniref:Transcriptional regulator PadR-like family protein n=1 Tax=Candidatus Bilamarchaeum dharawalense TaxID=2885759 RepID=A0A5E4LS95_9ARCH|nr:Transcriptional regulator PadR-like family protein [Candidatus Bilamarchaeum dharawalense]
MITSTPIKRLKRLLTSGNLWLYILSLVKSRKIYAYEMDELIEKEFFFKPGKIMIYIVLYRLENEGLITSKMEQRRKYYTITKKGKDTLNSAREYFKLLTNKL